MWDVSLLYIGVVVLMLAIGFVFALRMAISAARDADRQWQLPELAAEPAPAEPTRAAAPARRTA